LNKHQRKYQTKKLENEEIFQEVTLGEVLGEGTSGKVYKGMIKQTGQFIAVKHIALKKDDYFQSLSREICLLQTLKNPNIIRYFGCK
jgi:serine/threonine protein kinase